MSIPKPTGRPPVRDEKRRRANKSASYGLAEPVKAGDAGTQPDLGFEAHEMVVSMWRALAISVEGQFFSAADWQRARLEMWYADQVMTAGQVPSANQWAAVQRGMDELLVSPAVKRRAGIELKPQAVDEDEVAAVSMTGLYREKLKSV